MPPLVCLVSDVNRHTGGLEIKIIIRARNIAVNRHTGGLENLRKISPHQYGVNRHTGGLEKFKGA